MTTTEELIRKYEGYTDDALFDIHANIKNFTNEAKEALDVVLAKRGGIEAIQKKQDEKKVIDDEKNRIAQEATKLISQHTDIEFINTLVSSDMLPRTEVEKIIAMVYNGYQKDTNDKTITSRTVFGSLIGGTVASLIGGIIWGLQLITTGRMFLILFVGIAIVNYGIIRLLTKQSKKNKLVLISLIASVILSILIGQLLYEIFGYQGAQFTFP